jgi:predicted dehydrogenase
VRIAVVGLGAAGRRHARILRELGHDVVAVRRFPGEGEVASLDDAGGIDAVVVATPTAAHREPLLWAVERGVHAYVEKPLAEASTGLSELLDRADERGIVVATGYNLRFHPALETVAAAIRDGAIGRLLSQRLEAGQYLPDWHPEEDYRASYAARRELGGGALLTLSHELDLALWIAGDVVDVHGTTASVSALEIDVDDVAEVVLRHARGAVSSVHLDLLDRSYNRRGRWVGEHGTIAWEWGEAVLLLPERQSLWEADGYDAGETYRRALQDFLAAACDGRVPRADGRAGLRVLELFERVTQ